MLMCVSIRLYVLLLYMYSEGGWSHIQGKLLCLNSVFPSENGAILKGMNLLPFKNKFFPVRVDHFSEVDCV